MSLSTKLMWQTNIEDSADIVAETYGRETVNSIFTRYSATNFEDLNERFYGEVFSDFEQLIND